MASFDDRLNKLCARLAATPGKQVVVVEGTGDVAFFTIMLDKPPFR